MKKIRCNFNSRLIYPLFFACLLLCLNVQKGIGQDAIMSQFFASPVYLNPAFAGTSDSFRAVLNFRTHPLPDASNLSFISTAVDGYFPVLHGGLALSVTSDNKANLLWENHISAVYAYHLQFSRNWFVNFGAQAGYLRRDIRWSNLNFTDPSQPPPDQNWKHNVDFASGFLFYNNWFFGGLAVHHLTSPQISLFDESHRLDRKYTLHAGAFIEPTTLRRANTLRIYYFFSPNIIYQNQGPFQRINYGAYFGIESFMAGVWLRQDLNESNTMIFLVGLHREQLSIGYSYDYSFSGFTTFKHGIHELSLTFSFLKDERRGRQTPNCPCF